MNQGVTNYTGTKTAAFISITAKSCPPLIAASVKSICVFASAILNTRIDNTLCYKFINNWDDEKRRQL